MRGKKIKMTWNVADFTIRSTETAKQCDRTAIFQAAVLPRRLLCNRLEVLIHLTLLRVLREAGSERGKKLPASQWQEASGGEEMVLHFRIWEYFCFQAGQKKELVKLLESCLGWKRDFEGWWSADQCKNVFLDIKPPDLWGLLGTFFRN